jgi:hypothetical protein
MKWKNENGESFELKILGYEFPEILDERYDSNWLMVQIKLVLPQGKCEIVDAALLTWELIELRDWLSNFGTEGIRTRLDFTETTLSFALLKPNKTVRFIINDSMRYVSEKRKKSHRKIQLTFKLDFVIDKELAAALSLTKQLEAYPSRMPTKE